MKKIDAYIKKQRLNEVVEQLHMIEGLTGVSVHEIKGFGRSYKEDKPVHIVDNTLNWEPHVKLEIYCLDDLTEEIIEKIQKGAHTGLRSDGKIYVSNIVDAVRISTGEKGKKAI